jgi:hypothetical protein
MSETPAYGHPSPPAGKIIDSGSAVAAYFVIQVITFGGDTAGVQAGCRFH